MSDNVGEKRKKPKEGHWKKHLYTKSSMDKIVKEYWGDDFLKELIRTSDRIRRVSNKEYCMKRDRALMASLFLSGGRPNEVLKLRKDSFDFDNEEAESNGAFLVKELRVLKHWQKKKRIRVTRTFPIWKDDPLVDYLLDWRNKIDDYLFPSEVEGKTTLSYIRAYQLVTNVGEHLDEPYHITPTWFRKQREYHLVKKRGFSVYDLQAYLKLRTIPDIYRNRADWQNLLAIARQFKQEKFYEKSPYDAYKDTKKLLSSARKELCIIDPYVNETTIELYLEDIHPNVNIKLLTTNMYGKFRKVAKRFKIQQPNFEVRSTNEFHDRHLIIDGKVWTISQSLNKAGMKPLYIIELVDKDSYLRWFQKRWNWAKNELS